MAAEGPALHVVTVSYRCRELLRACLRSLEEDGRTDGPLQVTVVDNASADGTPAMVSSDFPSVDLVALEENVGFAAATNAGIRRGSAPYVLALNPDTRVTPGALDALVRLMESSPRIGICGPRLVREDGTLDHAAKRSFPTPLSALGYFSGLGRGARAPRALAQYTAPDVEAGAVDAVNGAFMLMRRRALDQVGLFDEGYWMYMEDLDLCYRFAQAGWLTWYEPSVTVGHVKAGSSGSLRSPRLNYAFHYGMLRFYRKHYRKRYGRARSLAVYAAIAAKLSVSVARTELRRAARRGRLRARST